ncbi:hypothetical protein JCM11491_004620 [Sporobolomyces phaffii]
MNTSHSPPDDGHDKPDLDQSLRPPKKPRTTTACNRCRKKRARCDGKKPICTGCLQAKVADECEYELGGDKRKPYTKAVVQAMQHRIDTLEAQLAALTGSSTSVNPDVDVDFNNHNNSSHSPPNGEHRSKSPVATNYLEKTAPQISQAGRLDTFQGGLALNAHGELRFYGPTSSYRAVLADSSSILNTPTTVHAVRTFSLTRAPIPTAAPADPSLPRRPPELSHDLKAKILSLAFEFCFSHYHIVPEAQFYQDFQLHPYERTQNYSPFLLNTILAVGCRYLDPDVDDFPPEICGLIGDKETRGDVFITWARYLLDQEWYCPAESTIRGLLVLGLLHAGRGFDGPCFVFVRLALCLTEDFGCQLGGHRLNPMGSGVQVSPAHLESRRNLFWTAFASDVIASMYIGRSISFSPDEIDVEPPRIVNEMEFEGVPYRSSNFHWASRLIFVGSKIMTTIYSLKPGISLQARQACVPEIHLMLESWYHALPSHLRASGSDPRKAAHPHILVLNCVYHLMHIALHRPFFRRRSPNSSINISTEKCLFAAANIVRLVKLLDKSAGLRKAAPGVQHAAFNAGTILAISAIEDGISDTPELDVERRQNARKDLKYIVASLKEIGVTWTTANTSAGVLEALMSQWEVATQAAHSQQHASSSSSSAQQQQQQPGEYRFPAEAELDQDAATLPLPPPPAYPPALANAQLPKLEEPQFQYGPDDPTHNAFGIAATGLSAGMGFGFLPHATGGEGGPGVGGLEHSFGASFPYMFPSWDADINETPIDFFSLLNVPESARHSRAASPTAQNQ